jgi:hypothetical protein
MIDHELNKVNYLINSVLLIMLFLTQRFYTKQFDPLILICCHLYFFVDSAPSNRARAQKCFSSSNELPGVYFLT